MTPSLYSMRLAASREDWAQLRALRYRAYREREAVAADAEEQYGDIHDNALNTMTFVLSRGNRTVGTTRTSVSSAARRWRLPGLEAYEDAIDQHVGREATIVEASHVVVDPANLADPKAALFHLFKAHILHCMMEDADWLLCAVREPEIGFYRRMFSMEILSGAEPYPGLAMPMVLMGLDYRANAKVLAKRIPMMAVSRGDHDEFMSTGQVPFGRPGK